MADLRLDLLVIPTYNSYSLSIADASTYVTSPPLVNSPTIEITPPGYLTISLPFETEGLTTYLSSTLGITGPLEGLCNLPDGVWLFKYSVSPQYKNYVEKSFMRTEIIQEKFDRAFMKLDMMECDKAIKKQHQVELNTIYFFIQGSIASANNCSLLEAQRLYDAADKMLDKFIYGECGCTGNNFITNFI